MQPGKDPGIAALSDADVAGFEARHRRARDRTRATEDLHPARRQRGGQPPPHGAHRLPAGRARLVALAAPRPATRPGSAGSTVSRTCSSCRPATPTTSPARPRRPGGRPGPGGCSHARDDEYAIHREAEALIRDACALVPPRAPCAGMRVTGGDRSTTCTACSPRTSRLRDRRGSGDVRVPAHAEGQHPRRPAALELPATMCVLEIDARGDARAAVRRARALRDRRRRGVRGRPRG